MQRFILPHFDTSKREQGLIVLFSIVFACCFSIGDSFRDNGSILVFFDSFRTGLLWLGGLLVYAVVGYIGINLLTAFVRHCRLRGDGSLLITKRWPVLLVLLLSWIPYLLCFFPGSIPYDGMYQLNMGLGGMSLNNHHPAALSVLYGAAIQLTRMAGLSDVMGIFILIVSQTLFAAIVFTELVRFVDEIGKKRFLTIACIVFFALYPIWGMMVQALIKDTLYTSFFALFALGFAKAVLYDRLQQRCDNVQGINGFDSFNSQTSVYVHLVIGALGMCFCRNNGIHVLLISVIAFLILGKEVPQRRKVVACLMSIACVFFLITGPVYSFFGVKQGSPKEALSIPLQQMARYISSYDSEINADEREIIGRVIDYESAKNKYEPTRSDNVKSTWNKDAISQDLLAFAQLYISFFMRHPGVFIEAPLHNSYNYYYFADPSNTTRDFQDYTSFSNNRVLSYSDYIPYFEDARMAAITWVRRIVSLPILDLFNRCGFYTWIMLLCILSFLIRKEPRGIIVVVPLAASVLICIASPVNGMHRYMWPVMATVVIPLSMVFAKQES